MTVIQLQKKIFLELIDMKMIFLMIMIVILSACQIETDNTSEPITKKPQNLSDLLVLPVSTWCNNNAKPFFLDFLSRASFINFTGVETFQGTEACRLDVEISDLSADISLQYYISNDRLCIVFEKEVKCGDLESFDVK